MTRNILIIVVIAALVVLFCVYFFPWQYKSSKPSDYLNAVITLERTMCFGTCPAYKLTIYGDGRVVYEGENYVKVTGTQNADISEDDVKGLVDEFYRIGYFSLADSYTADITDLPTTITSISIDGKTKQVVDYHGAPLALVDLEKRIDEVANTKIWVEG